MKTETRCMYNPEMKCRGAWFSKRRGKEIVSCPALNDDFMDEVEYFLTGVSVKRDSIKPPCIHFFKCIRKAYNQRVDLHCEGCLDFKPPTYEIHYDDEYKLLRMAMDFGLFGDEFDAMENTLETIEPWIRDPSAMTERICRNLKKAYRAFLLMKIKTAIEKVKAEKNDQ